jgi:hypothetical protein
MGCGSSPERTGARSEGGQEATFGAAGLGRFTGFQVGSGLLLSGRGGRAACCRIISATVTLIPRGPRQGTPTSSAARAPGIGSARRTNAIRFASGAWWNKCVSVAQPCCLAQSRV